MKRWIERWHGSGPDRGWWVWETDHGNPVAYIGEGDHSERLTSILVEKHNEALASTGADTARHGQDDHAGSPAPSEPVATLHDDGHYTFKPGKEPWGARQAGWRMDVYAPSAQSSKAALSGEDIEEVANAVYEKERFPVTDEVWCNTFWLTRFARAILARAGITPQAGKESGE